MSEIIEATATPAVVSTPGPEATPAAQVSAADLVRLTQGLYFIFWGLLVTVLVAAQTVVLLWVRAFSEVFLAGGVVATLMGTWRLQQARLHALPDESTGPQWRNRVGRLRGVATLLAYFCVLFYMWRGVPDNFYLQLNAAAFVATGIVYLMMLNRTITTLAAFVGRKQMALEARLFTAANIVLLFLPFAAALAYIVLMAVLRQTSLLEEFRQLLQRISLLVAIVVLLPVSLTLALVWAAKDTLVQELVSRDQPPPRPHPAP